MQNELWSTIAKCGLILAVQLDAKSQFHNEFDSASGGRMTGALRTFFKREMVLPARQSHEGISHC